MGTANELLTIARKQLGVCESPPGSNNVRYNTWFYGREVRDTPDTKYPWCMVFVQWCFDQAERRLPYTTASCSALLNWYRQNRPECIVTVPRPGDIIIYNFGHTGIVESAGGSTITAIEGNTSAGEAGSQSNGGGVFRRKRSKTLVTAYIRAFDDLDKEDIMTGKEIYDALNKHLKTQKVPADCQAEYQEAVRMGITDGTDPCLPVPRWQAAIMAKRAAEKGAVRN